MKESLRPHCIPYSSANVIGQMEQQRTRMRGHSRPETFDRRYISRLSLVDCNLVSLKERQSLKTSGRSKRPEYMVPRWKSTEISQRDPAFKALSSRIRELKTTLDRLYRGKDPRRHSDP